MIPNDITHTILNTKTTEMIKEKVQLVCKQYNEEKKLKMKKSKIQFEQINGLFSQVMRYQCKLTLFLYKINRQ